MSALLYYSMSAGLTADEKVEIDKEIFQNRKKVCIFVKNVASNAKGKTRKVIVVSILGGSLWFSSTPKNMPPQQEFVSDFTSVNSFESDVMRITPN